jgi:hypothetical protein
MYFCQSMKDTFRTVVPVKQFDTKINYDDGLFFMGSCFSDSVGQKFETLKFQATINPFGTIFNPISITHLFQKVIDEKPFVEEDFILQQDIWHCLQLHSSFSNTDLKQAILQANHQLKESKEALQKANWLFITFGTAWVYEYQKQVVANCHKMPANQFQKKIISTDEIVEHISYLLEKLKVFNPNLKIVFTVSPVRHWKDGVHENQLSKSTLLLAIHQLTSQFSTISYFPAYEIMLDELRDYRFYAKDMLHPSEEAEEYIFSYLKESMMSEKTQLFASKMEQLNKSLFHKPFMQQSQSHQQFLRKQLEEIEEIQKLFPKIDLAQEKLAFQTQILAKNT